MTVSKIYHVKSKVRTTELVINTFTKDDDDDDDDLVIKVQWQIQHAYEGEIMLIKYTVLCSRPPR